MQAISRLYWYNTGIIGKSRYILAIFYTPETVHALLVYTALNRLASSGECARQRQNQHLDPLYDACYYTILTLVCTNCASADCLNSSNTHRDVSVHGEQLGGVWACGTGPRNALGLERAK
jgi:hypothetical protein